MPDLLASPVFTTDTGRYSLPGLLAEMATGKVQVFVRLRPHQRPAWHMFLVQLGALALWRAGRDDLPTDEAEWRELLLALTDGDEMAWSLVAPDDRAAFLQPPVAPGLNWSRVETADALDMLITARNHDLKAQVAWDAEPEDWVYALISLQTGEGYGGAGNHAIIRMNGGSSSRAMLGLAPALPRGGGPEPPAWWRRDVERLLARRQQGKGLDYGTDGGPALLWTLPWPEGRQLALADLDPWFIEICRRIRLTRDGDRLSARRATSARARIAADGVNGVTGDPWAPVSMDAAPKSLTLSEGNFDYARICDLMFSGKWHRPALAEPGPGDGDLVLVAEAFSRGNSKTHGFKSRIIPVPGWARGPMMSADAGTVSAEQIKEIEVFDIALRNGLALVSAGGDREKLGKDHYTRTRDARDRLHRAADALFFPALWLRLAATGDVRQAAAQAFLAQMLHSAQDIFDACLPEIPCPSVLRPRAEARGKRAFRSTIWRGHGGGRDFSFLFKTKESANDPG